VLEAIGTIGSLRREDPTRRQRGYRSTVVPSSERWGPFVLLQHTPLKRFGTASIDAIKRKNWKRPVHEQEHRPFGSLALLGFQATERSPHEGGPRSKGPLHTHPWREGAEKEGYSVLQKWKLPRNVRDKAAS
jgi:hypothetical protein